MRTLEDLRPVTQADIDLAEMWRQLAADLQAHANYRGTNTWAKTALLEAAHSVSQAALVQDHGKGIERRTLTKYRTPPGETPGSDKP